MPFIFGGRQGYHSPPVRANINPSAEYLGNRRLAQNSGREMGRPFGAGIQQGMDRSEEIADRSYGELNDMKRALASRALALRDPRAFQLVSQAANPAELDEITRTYDLSGATSDEALSDLRLEKGARTMPDPAGFTPVQRWERDFADKKLRTSENLAERKHWRDERSDVFGRTMAREGMRRGDERETQKRRRGYFDRSMAEQDREIGARVTGRRMEETERHNRASEEAQKLRAVAAGIADGTIDPTRALSRRLDLLLKEERLRPDVAKQIQAKIDALQEKIKVLPPQMMGEEPSQARQDLATEINKLADTLIEVAGQRQQEAETYQSPLRIASPGAGQGQGPGPSHDEWKSYGGR